jgi:chromosome segregation ATPase
MSQPATPHLESDPERTAELPVLDPAAYAAAAERNPARTDTWIQPALAPAAAGAPAAPAAKAAAPPEAAGEGLSARLREAQGQLLVREQRLAQAERERDAAQAACVAAEQHGADLRRELEQLRAEHAFQQDEHAHAHSHFEEQLAQARALVSTAGARGDELQQRLDAALGADRTREAQEQERRQRLAHDRARAAGLMDDLHAERARSASYFETLQSAEARRQRLDEHLAELQRALLEREAELSRLKHEIGGREARAAERDGELARRAARIARLEQQVSSFTAELAQRDRQLRESRAELQALQDSASGLRSELTVSGERVRALQALARQHGTVESHKQDALARLLEEHATLAAAAEAARAAAHTATAQAGAHEVTLAQVRTRNAELEAALIGERRRVGQLEDEMAGLRREMQDWGGALKSAHEARNAQLTADAAAQRRLQELEQRTADQLEAVRALQAEANASAARAGELKNDLHAAEDAVNRLESEARARNARIEELEKAELQWRTALEDARHAITDTAASQALREAAREASAAAPAPAEPAAPAPQAAAPPPHPGPAPDGAVRLLVHVSDDGRELVHVLSRKTSIGRTPDNDLQIDAKYVSRHHAVVLAGPVHTIIEDLNSTNGVQINGRRITRQTLKDGDSVLIGRMHYRFTVRRGADKR